MALPHEILPPVEPNYIPTGRTTMFGDIPLYITGDESATKLLICIYGTAGINQNTQRFCDKMGTRGHLVVMPDFFRGDHYPSENYPQVGPSPMEKFLHARGQWKETVKPDLQDIIADYRQRGCNTFGIFGFSWGGRVAVDAAIELAPDIQGAVLIYPIKVNQSEGRQVPCPIFVMSTGDQPDFTPFCDKVRPRHPQHTGHHRFKDMAQGFANAEGNPPAEGTDDRHHILEAIHLTHTFFHNLFTQ